MKRKKKLMKSDSMSPLARSEIEDDDGSDSGQSDRNHKDDQ